MHEIKPNDCLPFPNRLSQGQWESRDKLPHVTIGEQRFQIAVPELGLS